MSDAKLKDKYASPLKTAKGMGSAHEGTDHWMKQKITAVLNIPLVLWFIWSMVSLQGATHAQLVAWQAQPTNAVLMIMLIISVLYHAKLGSQVVVEDYISNEWFKLAKLIAQKIFFFAVGVMCIFCVLKIAFTAGI